VAVAELLARFGSNVALLTVAILVRPQGDASPSSAILCALPVSSEAIGIDRDVRIAVKIFLFTLRADFTLYVGNYYQAGLQLCPERFPHAFDAAATAVRTGPKFNCFHIDRFAETRM